MQVLKILVSTFVVFLVYDTVNYLFEVGRKLENHQLELVKTVEIEESKHENDVNAVPALAFIAFVSSTAALLLARYLWGRRSDRPGKQEPQETQQLALPVVVEPPEEAPQLRGETTDVACGPDHQESVESASGTSAVKQELDPPIQELEDNATAQSLDKPKREEIPINIQVKCECNLLSFEDRLRIVESNLASAEETAKNWSLKIEKTETDIKELQKQVERLVSDAKSKVPPAETDPATVGDGLIPMFRRENYLAIKTLSDLIAETKKQAIEDDLVRSIGTQSELRASRTSTAEEPQRDETEGREEESRRTPGKLKTVTILLPNPEQPVASELRARETYLGREIEDFVSGLVDMPSVRAPVHQKPRRVLHRSAYSHRRVHEEAEGQRSAVGNHSANRYRHVASRYLQPKGLATEEPACSALHPSSAGSQAASLDGPFRVISSRSPLPRLPALATSSRYK